MLARLRSFPLPTRADWAALVDHSGDMFGAALIVFGGVFLVAAYSLI